MDLIPQSPLTRGWDRRGRKTPRGRIAIRYRPLRAERLEPKLALTSFLSGPWGWVGAISAIASNVASDADGNVYVAGSFSGSNYNAPLDFDPGPGEYRIRPTNGTDPAFGDAFVAKYNAEGAFQWVVPITAQWSNVGISNLQAAADGTIRLTGSANNRHAWASTSVLGISVGAGQSEGFACKVTSAGSIVWTTNIPRACRVQQNCATMDPTTDSLLIGADTQNLYRVTGDGAVVVTPLPFSRLSDLDGTVGAITVDRYAADRNGDIFLAGTLRGGADFDATQGAHELYGTFQWGWNSGYTRQIRQWSDDVFLAKYSASGALKWVTLQGNASAFESLDSFTLSKNGEAVTAIALSPYNTARVLSSFASTGERQWVEEVTFDSSMKRLIGLTHNVAGQVVLVTPNGLVDVHPTAQPLLSWRNHIIDGNVSGGYLDAFDRATIWSVGPLGYGNGWPNPRMESSGSFPIVAATANNGAYGSYPGTYFAAITEPCVPYPPTSLQATAGNSSAVLTWSGPAYSGGPALTDYLIQYSDDGGLSWVTFDDGSSTSTSATVTGLLSGRAYVFRIAASNGVGYGSYSLPSAFVTPTQAVVVDLAPGISSFDSATRVGATQLIKRGLGTLILDKPNSHFGGTVVEAGNVIIRNPAALGTGSLHVMAGGAVFLDVHDSSVGLESITLDVGALLDIGYGQVTVTASDPLTVRQWLASGRNGGNWDGRAGIRSRFASASMARAVGMSRGEDGTITLGYAAPGDQNLDGVIDILDISQLLSSGRWNTGQASWWDEGDFNYDGLVDVLDVFEMLVGQLFNSGPYTPALPAAPQPSSPALSAMDAVFLALGAEPDGIKSVIRRKPGALLTL